VRLEVVRKKRNPQLLVPSVQEDRTGLLAMVKLVVAVIAAAANGQDNALKTVRQSRPVRNEVKEALKVTLGEDVAVALARRLSINDVALVRRGDVPILPPGLAIDNLCRRSAIR
jgi:hypothetical protein